MNLLVRNVRILHPESSHHGQRVDIFIRNGKIESIDKPGKLPKGKETLEGEDLHVSAGWVDVGALTGDPGLEHREDLASASEAAAAGGFTTVLPFPNTDPIVHSKTGVQYILNRARGGLVDFLPIGAVTHNCEGREITEMYDMHSVGAVTFSDGAKSIQHGGVVLRALMYVKPFSGVIIHQPFDETVAGKGLMHEGITSTQLGMKGIPALAEELMVQRDLSILPYSESKLHLANISSAGSVEMIRSAKKRGLQVTASVAATNLALDDTALEDFDTNLKVLPPLRSKSDRQALYKGLKDGTIDFISSNHVPLDVESKNLEFPFAGFGAIGLETAFAVSNTHLQKILEIEDLVEKFSSAPRKIFGLNVPEIKEGAMANLTFFDPLKEWTFSEKDIFSKSKNTPFIGSKFKGKVLGVVNNGQWRRF